ncbi:MAG: RDD family protein [Actinomycetota bacterium]|nr:RDD family protein [Actinomycetota bacterium]
MDLPVTPAPQRARLRASAVDLVVIWGWLGALAGLSRLPLLRRTGYAELFRTPATADLAQFATGVLPVWLYLLAGEAGSTHATRGKRAAGLTVVDLGGEPPSRSRIAARAAVKLLPWQLAHLAINRAVGIGTGRRSTRLAAMGFGAALGLAGGSVALATTRSDGGALHDLAAGTRVVPAQGARR